IQSEMKEQQSNKKFSFHNEQDIVSLKQQIERESNQNSDRTKRIQTRN
ncbi:unnamed protein product, partial [Rotaria sp. Silwood1]